MRSNPRRLIPFTAILGQDDMKKALLLNVIDPRIGGVLVRGDKGTAKSTSVRALAELLPEIPVVAGCTFGCDPFDYAALCSECQLAWDADGGSDGLGVTYRKVRVIELPLGATEDRVVGSVDIERAIKEGTKSFQAGLLASANRGILYVDEVNLLEDHIADLLLDAAALGVNTVEREGIQVAHPANFSLVGTMNPEEGEIRPQLLDRFGLQASVRGADDSEIRLGIVELIDELDRDPHSVWARHVRAQQRLQEQIVDAQRALGDVKIERDTIWALVETCRRFQVNSHRAEVTTLRASKAIAALAGREVVDTNDVQEALYFTLPHRMRRTPFESPTLERDQIDATLENVVEESNSTARLRPEQTGRNREGNDGEEDGDGEGDDDAEEEGREGRAHSAEASRPGLVSQADVEGDGVEAEHALHATAEHPPTRVLGIGKNLDPRGLKLAETDRRTRVKASGRRIRTRSSRRGAYIRARNPTEQAADIALDATIRSAASHARSGAEGLPAVRVKSEDIKEKVRVDRFSPSTVFVVDSSGSMDGQERMESAKGAILSMLVDSYQKRDRVGMVALREDSAETILPMCSSPDLAATCLRELPTGGRTPISAGLQKALQMLTIEQRRNPEGHLLLVLISDGRANVALSPRSSVDHELKSLTSYAARKRIHMMFIDVEDNKRSSMRFGAYKKILMDRMSHYRVGRLSSDAIEDIVSQEEELLLSS